MRISDWSSDVCSSDLISSAGQHVAVCDNGTLISMKRGAHGKPAHLVHTAYTPPGAKALAVVTAESFVDPSPPPLEAPTITRRRSEERRVGKEWVSTCRSRWSPYN